MKSLFTKQNWEFKLGIFIVLYYIISSIIFQSDSIHRDTGLSNHLRVIPSQVIDHYDTTVDLSDDPKLNKYAYVQYATTYEYFNLAILNFIALRKSNTTIPNLVILYDDKLTHYQNGKFNNLVQLCIQYNIKLKPIYAITPPSKSSTWAHSFSKLYIFNLIEYDRIVYFDSDSMFVNNQNIDELFKLPSSLQYAMPQAYWLNNIVENKPPFTSYHKQKLTIPDHGQYSAYCNKIVNKIRSGKFGDWFQLLPKLINDNHKYDNYNDFFGSHVMIVEPNRTVFQELYKYVYNPWYWKITNRSKLRLLEDYDMEIINKYFNDKLRKNSDIQMGILPHKEYGVLTGEFKEKFHKRFMAEPQFLPFIKKKDESEWDANEVLKSIKLVHFSDAPIPKPWEEQDNYSYYNTFKIYCDQQLDLKRYNQEYPSEYKPRLTSDCASVKIWNSFMDQFEANREGYWVV